MAKYNFSQKIKDSLSRYVAEPEVHGIKYRMQPPCSKDENILSEIVNEIGQDPENALASLGNLRTKTLATMLTHIDGEAIPEVCETESGDKVERVIYMSQEILSWPLPLVSYLYQVANDFRDRTRKELRSSVKYEWFGNNILEEEEREEKAEEEKLRALEIEAAKQALTPVDAPPQAEETSSFTTPELEE